MCKIHQPTTLQTQGKKLKSQYLGCHKPPTNKKDANKSHEEKGEKEEKQINN
jgi:hypothetical protein